MPAAPLRPPSPGALQRIERGTLAPFELEATANAGTGVLEAYLEERTAARPVRAPVPWGAVGIGTLLGALLAVTVVVAGARTGLVVAFGWHVALVAVLAARRGTEAALVAGTGALVGGAVGAGLLFVPAGTAPFALVAAVGGGALLAVAGVVLLRRAWTVDAPRPFPGAQGHVRVLALAEAQTDAAAGRARHALSLFGVAAAGAAAFALVREASLRGGRFVDGALGAVRLPGAFPVGFAFSPLAAGVGWLLGPANAWRLAAGAAAAALVVVPLAVAFDVPVGTSDGTFARPSALFAVGEDAAAAVAAGVVAPLGAGALGGAGLWALARRVWSLADLRREARAREPGDGYAWPRQAALAAGGAGLVALLAALATGATPLAGSALAGLAALLVGTIAVLAWQASAEGREPVTGPAVAAAFVLVPVGGLLGAPLAAAVAVGAVAAACAAGAAFLLEVRVGLHAGVRPYGASAAALVAVVPAAAAGALVAALLALTSDVASPQARALGALADPDAGARAGLLLLLLGLAAGVLAEVAGLGIAFALGLLVPFAIAAPLALGALARHLADRRAAARAATASWDEDRRLLRFLDATLVAGGLVVGEAVALAGLAAWRGLA